MATGRSERDTVPSCSITLNRQRIGFLPRTIITHLQLNWNGGDRITWNESCNATRTVIYYCYISRAMKFLTFLTLLLSRTCCASFIVSQITFFYITPSSTIRVCNRPCNWLLAPHTHDYLFFVNISLVVGSLRKLYLN